MIHWQIDGCSSFSSNKSFSWWVVVVLCWFDDRCVSNVKNPKWNWKWCLNLFMHNFVFSLFLSLPLPLSFPITFNLISPADVPCAEFWGYNEAIQIFFLYYCNHWFDHSYVLCQSFWFLTLRSRTYDRTSHNRSSIFTRLIDQKEEGD